MELTHGGDWAGYRAEYGAMPLDFSANISPLGLPQGVRQRGGSGAGRSGPLPGPAVPGTARESWSGTLGVPPEQHASAATARRT